MGIISDLVRQKREQEFLATQQQQQQQKQQQDVAALQQFLQSRQQLASAEQGLSQLRALPPEQRGNLVGPNFPAFQQFPTAQSQGGAELFGQFLLQQQKQQGQQPFTLGPGQQRFGPGGQPIAQIPAAQTRLTESQFRAKEGQRIFDIPPEERTAKEQKRLDDILTGNPLVQVQLPGEQVAAGKEQIGILRDLQTAATEFNLEGIAPNFQAVVKTDVKGRNVIALEPKTKPTSEERNQEVLLTAVRDSMKNIAEVATAKRVGPIQGQITRAKAELIGNDPSGAELVSELNSLILFVYGLSGKQVNETEFKVLGKLMPQVTDPDTTFSKRYDTFLRRLKTISGIRNDIWSQIGVSRISKEAKPQQPGTRVTLTPAQQKRRAELRTKARQ